MQDQEGTEGREVRDDKNMELQLGGRHLTLAVAGLAVFGLVLFLLGRWSERVAEPAVQAPEGIEETSLSDAGKGTDPAAPKELTFYETLGKRATPAFQQTSRQAARKEPPVVLPETAPVPPAPAAKSQPATAAKSKPPAPAPPAADGTERFRVQVASTRDASAARLLVSQLQKKGYPASLETTRGSDGRPQYKVRVGNYSERGPAEELAGRLRTEEKVGAWIVRVQG